IQHLHGRACRLPHPGRLPARDTRVAERRRADTLPPDLARQQQGKVPVGLAPRVRPGGAHRRRLGLRAVRRRSAQGLVPGV
ncbi:uncharacterized protein METZ01_LOCUS188736, partial [marine metagenome]